MKTTTRFASIGLSLFAAAAVGKADTIELKDGGAIQGKYVGGTATTIDVETAQGTLSVPTSQVLALKFTAEPAAPPIPAPPPPPAPAASRAVAPVSIPAGTVLVVRMDTQVSSNDPAGKTFSATLVADVVAGNVTVAKAGSTVLGRVEKSKQARRLAGKSQLAMSLTGIDLGGKILPILTTNFAEAGKGEFRKTARNVAAGALIGNAVDSSGGAGAGAAVGAGVSLIKKGDAVTVPPGALLEFRLTQPASVPAR